MKNILQLTQDPKELRKFGLTVGGILGLIAWVLFKKANGFYPYLGALSLFLIVFGIVLPRSLRGVYKAWMSLAVVLGIISTTIILGLFFYLVITPISIFIRLAGNDLLNQKWDPKNLKIKSYWIPIEKNSDPLNYEKQY